VVDECGFDVVLFLKDEIAEGDGGVGVCVGVDCCDLVYWDLGEEFDGEGWAVAADHSGGDEDEWALAGLGFGVVDNGGESDICLI